MTVQRIVDGDTIEVAFANGEVADVRLLGVDTPEVHTETDPAEFERIPDSDSGHDHLRTWGERASSFASERLEIGEEIRIVVDPEADRRGSYGRLLVYLYDDGELFNLLLLDQGYARLYESEFSKRDRFTSAESTAQTDEIGLWNYTTSTPTQTATASEDGDIDVAEIHEDADGNDHENLNDEYIVLENTGQSELDLSGWTISDEADHSYTIPNGFSLDPGETVTLYTGSGTDTDSELYWGSERAIWNNGGDTITITDASGSVVLQESY